MGTKDSYYFLNLLSPFRRSYRIENIERKGENTFEVCLDKSIDLRSNILISYLNNKYLLKCVDNADNKNQVNVFLIPRVSSEIDELQIGIGFVETIQSDSLDANDHYLIQLLLSIFDSIDYSDVEILLNILYEKQPLFKGMVSKKDRTTIPLSKRRVSIIIHEFCKTKYEEYNQPIDDYSYWYLCKIGGLDKYNKERINYIMNSIERCQEFIAWRE